jgi:hypothetical protein
LKSILATAAVRILVPPLVGLLFYGSWAYWVNMSHGEMIAFKAACTQGGYSFAITLILALIIESLFKVLKELPAAHILVMVIACCLLYTSSWGINALLGTPNILWTILPGAIISTIYTISYVLTLSKINVDTK